MNNKDFIDSLANKSKHITYISSYTENAQPNSETEAHPHYDEFEIYHFIEGDLLFFYNGKKLDIPPGTVLIIAPGVIHKPIIRKACRYRRSRILFNKKIFARHGAGGMELFNRLSGKSIIVVESNYSMEEKLLEIGELAKQNSTYHNYCAQIKLISLVMDIEKHGITNDSIPSSLSASKISEVIEYIDNNLNTRLTCRNIAVRLYLTERVLYRVFKKETGFSLSDYINKRRLIKAQEFINTGATADYAASAAGFTDYSVFYRNFKKEFGISPAEYIKNQSFNFGKY